MLHDSANFNFRLTNDTRFHVITFLSPDNKEYSILPDETEDISELLDASEGFKLSYADTETLLHLILLDDYSLTQADATLSQWAVITREPLQYQYTCELRRHRYIFDITVQPPTGAAEGVIVVVGTVDIEG